MKIKTLLTTMGLSAGAMYFFDPHSGARRRAQIGDQVNHLINQADDSIDVAMQDLRNRSRGVLYELAARLDNQGAPDRVLEERVRARMGLRAHPAGAVQVKAEGGRIILSGLALPGQIDSLVKIAARTRGVKEVESRVELVDDPESIPGLRGMQSQSSASGSIVRRWTPARRLVSGAGGGLLALYGLRRGGLFGPALGLGGLYMAARGVTNLDARSMLGMAPTDPTIQVQKSINIDAPIDVVYGFWSNFENFPLFMNHIKEIQAQNGHSHWVVAGPAGTSVEFEAHKTRDIPNELIAWETEPSSQVQHTGFVRFDENRDGSTRVTVQMRYLPPAGVAGHAVAKLFGVDPRQAMNADLARLKTLLEEGQTSTDDAVVRYTPRSSSTL